jgi:hypothetical protein
LYIERDYKIGLIKLERFKEKKKSFLDVTSEFYMLEQLSLTSVKRHFNIFLHIFYLGEKTNNNHGKQFDSTTTTKQNKKTKQKQA